MERENQFKEIHFFGDKTYKGGNDYVSRFLALHGTEGCPDPSAMSSSFIYMPRSRAGLLSVLRWQGGAE